MKLTLLLLVASASFAVAQAVVYVPLSDSGPSYRSRVLADLQRQQEIQRLERALQLQQIHVAYPQQPLLYRYLERNPRYIPTYLGK